MAEVDVPVQYDMFEDVVFKDDKNEIHFNLDPNAETIWATQVQMSRVFGVTVPTISEHLRNIFKSAELDEDSVVRKFRITADDGKSYRTNHYALDAILAVGYRVSSKKATKFRQWATQTLKQYILQGYVINEVRIDQDPDARRKLAKEVRVLRTKEKNIYEAVRTAFRDYSSDYHKDSKSVGKFFALLQDTFLWATTERTSARIVLDRADHKKDDMGLLHKTSANPTLNDARVGKNYLQSVELDHLHLICEQFLNMVEGYVIRDIKLSMDEMYERFCKLLESNDYPKFPGYKGAFRKVADEHARNELQAYNQRVRLEKKAGISSKEVAA